MVAKPKTPAKNVMSFSRPCAMTNGLRLRNFARPSRPQRQRRKSASATGSRLPVLMEECLWLLALPRSLALSIPVPIR